MARIMEKNMTEGHSATPPENLDSDPVLVEIEAWVRASPLVEDSLANALAPHPGDIEKMAATLGLGPEAMREIFECDL